MTLTSHFVFCDDIRREDNGKLILIGVYPEDLVPGILPQLLHISVWASIRGVPVGRHDCVLVLEVNGTEQIRQPGLVVECQVSENPLNLTLVGLPASLVAAGHIRVSVECDTWPTTASSSLIVRDPRVQATT